MRQRPRASLLLQQTEVSYQDDCRSCQPYKWNKKYTYISPTNRMRGPYRKLWTDIFSSPYGQSAKRAEKLKQRGKKRWSITYGTDQANEVNKMFIMWHLCWKRKPFMYKNDACQTIDFIGCQKLLCNGFPAHLSQNKPILEWICCLMQKIFKVCRDKCKELGF